MEIHSWECIGRVASAWALLASKGLLVSTGLQPVLAVAVLLQATAGEQLTIANPEGLPHGVVCQHPGLSCPHSHRIQEGRRGLPGGGRASVQRIETPCV